MKTNLIFKRVIGNPSRTEMKVVSVHIPIDREEGWQLASWCDSIDVVQEDTDAPVSDCNTDASADSSSEKNILTKECSNSATDKKKVKHISAGEKYISAVPGTARLVRVANTIFITYRKGKKTHNQNDPNSVCISDTLKNKFFSSVKRIYGNSVVKWQIVSTDDEYSYWNQLIDEIYESGREEVNKLLDLGLL